MRETLLEGKLVASALISTLATSEENDVMVDETEGQKTQEEVKDSEGSEDSEMEVSEEQERSEEEGEYGSDDDSKVQVLECNNGKEDREDHNKSRETEKRKG